MDGQSILVDLFKAQNVFFCVLCAVDITNVYLYPSQMI